MENQIGQENKDRLEDWITKTLKNVREVSGDDFVMSKLMDKELKVMI